MLSDNNEAAWKRPASIAAAVVALVILVLTVAYACATGGDDTVDGGVSEAAPDLTAAPQRVTWAPYKAIQLPSSAVSGPKGQESGAPTGYEHSPQGAALAAVQTPMRIAVADDATWPELVRVAVAPGPGRDAFSVNRVQLTVQGESNPETRPRVRGYRITDYSPQAATVEVVTSYIDESLASTRVAVVWRDDDWKVVLPDPNDPQVGPATTALPSLPADLVVMEAPK